MCLLLGIDLGTSGLKAALFEERGRMLSKSYSANRYIDSGRGRAEQDPQQWWQGCCRAIEQAIAAAGVQADRIAALGVCGFHHCPVFLDEAGKPVRPTIAVSYTHLRAHET